MDSSAGLLQWVASKLRTAVVNDIAKDFCDGTVLMELTVLLLTDNEAAVAEALEKFTDTPTTMSHSLDNIKSVLACLASDGTHLDVKPLDIFRGKREVVVGILEVLRSKYDNILSDTRSSTLTKQDIITGESTLTKQDIITDWTRSVCEHTESLRQERHTPVLESDHSDHDTGFIEPSSNGSGGEEEGSREEAGSGAALQITSADVLSPEPRPQDESYSSIDVIEVDEKLVRADSRIVLSHESCRKACVYVSISMKYEVTDVAARDSFLKQATKNYTLSGCEVPHKDLSKLSLGYLNLLVTSSYTRSLRTKSVGIYSPFLLGLQTVNIAESRQLFAHVLRGRVKLTAHQKSEHVKFTMKNVSKAKVHVVIPEGTVWQQVELNGDSHVVTIESTVRALYPEETEVVNIPSLYLNRQGGRNRGQPLALTPFIFRGPLGDQERLFGYSDPDEEGHFRFCQDCNGVICRDMYGVSYHQNRPYHLECGPACTKCGLSCFSLLVKEEDKPYCSLECYYLSGPGVQYCNKCGYVLAPSDKGMVHRRSCPKTCRICTMLCLDLEHFPGPVCSKLCRDWDTSKNRICQGCAQPIIHKSTSIEIDKMFFHSVHCFKLRATSPPLIVQRAMVRGKSYEVQELRRLCKVEFEKRSERRREALRLRKEERERSHNLQNVMDCITKIEGINKEDGDRKYGTLQPKRRNKPEVEQRTRSLSSAGEQSSVKIDQSRKRTNTKRPGDLTSWSDTGSFLDLLFSSDEEDGTRPCRFARSTSDRRSIDSQRRKQPLNFEKRKLNRGFPSGDKQSKQTRARTRMKSTESESSDTMMISCPARPSKRFLSLKRSASKGSTGSTASSCSNPISPVPKMEFERPNLFDQLRCEQQVDMESNTVPQRTNGRSSYGRQKSAPPARTNVRSSPVHIVPNIKQSRSKDSMISRFAQQRNTATKQLRSEHTIQVHKDCPRLSPDDRTLRTPSSDGGYYSGKNLSPNEISNGHTSRSKSVPHSRSKSANEGPRKVSPTFDMLFDDVTETRSPPTRGYQTLPRKATPMVESRTVDDPLVMALAGNSLRSQPYHKKSNFISSRKPRVTTPEDGPVVVEPPRLTKPLTDAQRRYERRFSKSQTMTRSVEPVERDLLDRPPTPPYPVEMLTSTSGYSLDMINPDLKSETWTCPRLEDALQEPSSQNESDATVRSEMTDSIFPDLDLEIEAQLLDLENELGEELSDEDNMERIVDGAGIMSLSSTSRSSASLSSRSLPHHLIMQDAGL